MECDYRDKCKSYDMTDTECTTGKYRRCMIRHDKIRNGVWKLPKIEIVVNEDHIETIKQEQDRI